MLVAGVDEYGPSLNHTDPSGTFVRYEAKAIGAGSEGAQTQLQETYSKTMTLAEAEVLALNTLKQVYVLPPPFLSLRRPHNVQTVWVFRKCLDVFSLRYR